jgi:hypothetical protein
MINKFIDHLTILAGFVVLLGIAHEAQAAEKKTKYSCDHE